MPNKPKQDNDKDKKENKPKKSTDRFRGIRNLLGQMNLSLYGTDRTSEVDSLDAQFQDILSKNVDNYMGIDIADPTSFLAKLSSETSKSMASAKGLRFRDVSVGDPSPIGTQLEALYENRMQKQADLMEVSSNLVELNEAILITRDAIVSAESVEGKVSRTINFKNKPSNTDDLLIPMVERLEDKFNLQHIIKNFIVPKVLTYGEYYAYIIPYSKLFKKISDKKKISNNTYTDYGYGLTLKESYVSESVSPKTAFSKLVKESYDTYKQDEIAANHASSMADFTMDMKNEFENTLSSIYDRIEISNGEIPIPVLESGQASVNEYFTEAKPNSNEQSVKKTIFDDITDPNSSGEYMYGTYIQGPKKIKNNEDFKDIQDCYIKLIDPTKMIPIKIMDEVLGYYYVVAEETTPLNGILAAKIKNTLTYGSNLGGEKNIIDDIAEQVVKAFNKDFLKDNLEFKRLIVKAIDYYDVTTNKIKFQYIPAEYVQVFKLDCDEDGNGRSLIEKSLFYAKLYMTLLLFKMMSIVNYSNDIRVNYIRGSGISKDMANQVQDIARQRQSRQINMHDLFSLTTMANKIGNGHEMIIPMTRNNDKPIETEILSGQDVQLNTDFMEMLKNNYILGTGVPAAIVNYLNEADFAKTVEQNNTKYHARVLNYQLDLNKSVTEMYKRILRFASNMEDTDISNFEFTFTQPRSANESVKAEAINNFNSKVEFILSLYFNQNDSEDPIVQQQQLNFKLAYAKQQLPQLRFDEIQGIMDEAKSLAVVDKSKPKQNAGLGDDDIGLEDIDMNDL